MIIGMDFGTTNSGMSVFDGDRLRLIPLDPTNPNPHVARTALYITNDREVHIGRGATDTYYQQNLNRSFKLERVRVGEIEMTFADVGTFIRDVYIERDVYSPGRLFLSFKMGLSSDNYLGTLVGTNYYYLEDIIAVYLYTARKRAENHLGREVDTIVLGRPVRFSDDDVHNDLARERLLQAAFRAGYKRVYLQYEPIAAAYYYEMSINREENVLIFDFGGGTLDLSIVRIGNPKTRRVLATGGIPIAGDVFDRKIVRSKFPKHFGEGTTYYDTNQELPIPSSYYEAFSDWQTLLNMQMPQQLERLRRVQQSASAPRQIQALIDLITSNHSLKMFDVAEGAKRGLSDKLVTFLDFTGPGFNVHESITRPEFESIIRSDVRAINERLDEVLAQAELQDDQIHAVIRTGGSSQIPVFIEMLNRRFGAARVRDIDAFSSVTSGLGVIGHQIERGEADLPVYRPEDIRGGDYLNNTDQGGIPVVDLDLLKKLITIREDRLRSGTETLGVVALNADHRLTAGLNTRSIDDAPATLDAFNLTPPINAPVDLLPPEKRVLLMTTEYRFFLKTVQQLADLRLMGVDFSEIEELHEDAFGREIICGLARWRDLDGAAFAVMLSTYGQARRLIGETLMSKLEQPVGYTMERLKGYPAALIKATAESEIAVFTDSGRAVRVPVAGLGTQIVRIIKRSRDVNVIGGLTIDRPCEVVLATAGGYAKRIAANEIPRTDELNTSGQKIVSRSGLVSALIYRPGQPAWAITTQRLAPVDLDAIPCLDGTTTTKHKLLRLKKGETLLALVAG